MKRVYFTLIIILCLGVKIFAQELTIIEQDYNKAIKIAAQENKLLFIDFYTTWCAPCKKLDKLVFQNESVQPKLGKDFILLRYDAENDSIFNLAKKHHVNSYPTAIILNNERYVVNRKYGFSGEDFNSLSKNVYEFTNNSLNLAEENKILKGYSNTIEASKYPKFYIDYINRDNIKIDKRAAMETYLATNPDIYSEAFFSTLIYFGSDAPDNIANIFLDNKEKYIELYGETDVNTALFFFSISKFDTAVALKSKEKFNSAKEYSLNALGKKSADQLIVMFEQRLSD